MAGKISEKTSAGALDGTELLEVSVSAGSPEIFTTRKTTAQEIADLAVTGGASQPLDATLTALAGLATGASKVPYSTGTDTFGQLTLDTDTALAANSDTTLATQKAVKAYADALVAGLLDLKTGTDCSGNPNYPAASKGDAYYVTVAGKIGGASGKSVDVGDVYVASADNAGGTEASVGTSWFVLEHNLAGVYVAGGTDVAVADGGTGTSTAAGARENLKVGMTVIYFMCGDLTTALTTGTTKGVAYNPFSTVFNVVEVFAALAAAQTSGSTFTVDINEGAGAGTSILSTKLTIDNGDLTGGNGSGTASATPAVVSDASIAAFGRLTVDIDALGDGTAKGLMVGVIGYPSA